MCASAVWVSAPRYSGRDGRTTIVGVVRTTVRKSASSESATDVVEPLAVSMTTTRRCGTGQQGALNQLRQSPAASIRVDCGAATSGSAMPSRSSSSSRSSESAAGNRERSCWSVAPSQSPTTTADARRGTKPACNGIAAGKGLAKGPTTRSTPRAAGVSLHPRVPRGSYRYPGHRSHQRHRRVHLFSGRAVR